MILSETLLNKVGMIDIKYLMLTDESVKESTNGQWLHADLGQGIKARYGVDTIPQAPIADLYSTDIWEAPR